MINTPSDPFLRGESRAACSTSAHIPEGVTSGSDKKEGASAASSVAEKAREMTSSLSHQAEEATSAVAAGMVSLADSLRSSAPQEGMLGRTSTAVADTLDAVGDICRKKASAA